MLSVVQVEVLFLFDPLLVAVYLTGNNILKLHQLVLVLTLRLLQLLNQPGFLRLQVGNMLQLILKLRALVQLPLQVCFSGLLNLDLLILRPLPDLTEFFLSDLGPLSPFLLDFFLHFLVLVLGDEMLLKVGFKGVFVKRFQPFLVVFLLQRPFSLLSNLGGLLLFLQVYFGFDIPEFCELPRSKLVEFLHLLNFVGLVLGLLNLMHQTALFLLEHRYAVGE